MYRRVALIAGLLAAIAAAPAVAAASQPLTIAIDDNGAHARRLEHYTAGKTIAIDAAAPTDVDGVTLSVTDPDGRLQSLSLAHAGSGHFTGSLTLPETGSYEFQVATSAAGQATPTEPFSVDVEEQSDTAWLVGIGVGSATFCLFGGVGLIALRRFSIA
jgi:VCBS repeat-containing protein